MSVFDEMDSKDIYLQKPGETTYVGLHSIGEADSVWVSVDLDGNETVCNGFQAYESWGNEYDENFKMIGRGSFRVFGDIEEAAEDMIKDGYVKVEGPKKENL